MSPGGAARRGGHGQLVGPRRHAGAPSRSSANSASPHEVRVVSAHRTPDEMLAFGKDAADRGLRVLIAGAGGAAHLPGMLASVDDAPGDRRARGARPPRRPRLPAVHRPDAQGGPGGHGGGERRPQRRRAGRADPGAAETHAGSAWARSSRRWPRAHGPRMLAYPDGAATTMGEPTLAQRLGLPAEARLVIVNADDLGYCHVGQRRCLRVPAHRARHQRRRSWCRARGPRGAARYRGEDVGVHLTVNAEYELYRWGPITHAPSLLGGDGGFPGTVEDVWDHADLDEVRSRCRAQIERAILWGFDVSHLDAHMGALALRPEILRRVPRPRRRVRAPHAHARARPWSAMVRVPGPDSSPRRGGSRLHRPLPDDVVGVGSRVKRSRTT